MGKIILNEIVQSFWLNIGISLINPTKNTTFVAFLVIGIITSINILAALTLIFENFNLSAIAEVFQVCGPATQMSIKMLVVRCSIKKVREMFHQIETQFWKKEKLGPDFAAKLLLIEKRLINICKSFEFVVYSVSIVGLLRPLLFISTTRDYPVAMYDVIDRYNNKLYALMYGYQVVVCYICANILLAVDGLYFLFLVNICVQLFTLKTAFSKLELDKIQNSANEMQVYNKLIEYIEHHNFILRFIKEFGNFYSFQVFCQFLGNTLSLCMGLYLFNEGQAEKIAIIRGVPMILLFFVELLFFCVGGTVVSILCGDIAFILFANGWEQTRSKRIRFAVYMIIMRSNKPEIIKAGEIFQVNITAIVKILNASFSIFTLMTNIILRKAE